MGRRHEAFYDQVRLPHGWGGDERVEPFAADGSAVDLEAEYLSAAQVVKEALWFCKL